MRRSAGFQLAAVWLDLTRRLSRAGLVDLWARPLTALSTVSRIRRLSSLPEMCLPRMCVPPPTQVLRTATATARWSNWLEGLLGLRLQYSSIAMSGRVRRGPKPRRPTGSLRIGFSHHVVVVYPA